MLVRALEFVRFFALLIALSIIAPTSPTVAADGDMVWSFSEGNDASNRGRMTARLGYGIPETDNAQADGVCEARSGTSVSTANLILGADVGKLAEGSSVNVRFTGGGFNHFVSGIVYGTKLEEGITGVSLDINVKDPLWKALTEKDSLDYLVPGYSASKLNLKDGHGKIRQFIRACKSYAEALGPDKMASATPEPKKKEPKKGIQYQTASGPEKKTETASSNISEKEAYDAAKELGTIEAWEAFLNNYSKGFRADLARAYLKRLGNKTPKTPAAPPAPKVTKAPTPPPPPPSPADISITETANQASCKGEDSCSYTMVATNTGGTAFTGQLVITNSLSPRGATLTSTGNAPWFCQSMGGGAVCTNANAIIEPGASTNLSLTFTLPRNAGGSVTSCASISWGGAPTGSSVRDVQQALSQRGFNPGPADGQAGRKTVEAIRAHQIQSGLQPTGEIDLPLLMSLFTVPGAGDANPNNDQACAGAAVTAAPAAYTPQPRPTANYCADGRLRNASGQCVCPAVVPIWTGKTCVPRRTRNCSGGRYYNKKRKLCLCPSRKPYWYNNRCHAGVDDCPGDSVRVGSQCIKENDPAFETRRGGQGIACPAGSFRVGTNCVQTNLAPLFTFGKKPKGGGNAQRPGTNVQTFGFGKPKTGGGGGGTGAANCPQATMVFKNGKCQCRGGSVRGACITPWNVKNFPCKDLPEVWRSGRSDCGGQNTPPPVVKGANTGQKFCAAGQRGSCKCPPGLVKDTASKNASPCRPACTPGKVRIFGVCCTPGSNVSYGHCCPRGQEWKGNRCVGPANTNKLQQQNKNIACAGGGTVINGRCVCPSNRPRFENGKCKKPEGNQFIQQLPQQPQNQPQVQQQANCTGGQVPNGQGGCACPTNKPRWSKGKCKKQKALNQFLNQLQQQPQNQPQTQPPQQDQQQLLNQQLNKLFSDVRLKRNVEHLATLESGIRLYSFRYLWSDRVQVGVMAQDMLRDPARRDAVSLHRSGYYMVDYGKLGLRMVTLEEWKRRGMEAVLASHIASPDALPS